MTVTISGICARILKSNKEKAKMRFVLSTESGTSYRCEGECLDITAGMPITVTGTDTGKYIAIEKIDIDAENKNLNYRWFQAAPFKLSEGVAAKLAALVGTDLYGFIEKPDTIEKICKTTKKDTDWAETFITAVNDNKVQHQVLQLIEPADGGIGDAVKICRKYGRKAYVKLKENPYVATKDGVFSLAKADKLAQSLNFNAHNEARIECLIVQAMNMILKNGSTKTSFKQLYKTFLYVAKTPSFSEEEYSDFEVFDILMEVKSIKFYEGIFYFSKMLYYEKETAWHIKRLRNTAIKRQIKPNMRNKFEDQYDSVQQQIFDIVENGGLAILTGPPGSGKTHVVRGFIDMAEMVEPNCQTKLAATTGCAAQRLSESTGREAVTAAKMLEPAPDTMMPTRTRYNPLEADFLVVDEFSMADLELSYKILDAAKNGCTVLLCGDADQLKSVGPGQVFKDIIDSGVVPVIRLEKIYRQGEGSEIISQNAVCVNTGNQTLTTDSKRFFRMHVEDTETAFNYADTLFDKLLKRYPENAYTFLTLLKKNVSTINDKVHEKLFPNRAGREYDGHTYCIGERVMMLRNNYEVGYFNGDCGVVTGMSEDGVFVRIDGQEDDSPDLEISEANMDDMTYAYSKTVHKAQGAECPCVVIILTEESACMLTRDILYTAITRASQQVILIDAGESVRTCISDKYRRKRNTGLNQKLKEVFCDVVA